MLIYKKWYDFARYVHEQVIVKNNTNNGIKCIQADEEQDRKHIDIIYNNGQTEDCKYCGKSGIYINEHSLKAATTWVSAIIQDYDYKVKLSVLKEKYEKNLTFDKNKNESFVYIPIEDFKNLATKKYKVDENLLKIYNEGKNIVLSNHNDNEIHESLKSLNVNKLIYL